VNREPLDPDQRSILLRQLKQKRSFLNSGLPTYDSVIGLEIFLVMCECELRGQHPRLKDIHLEISRSQGAVRRLVRALADDGWVQLVQADHDARSRLVVPTPRLRRTIAGYLATLPSRDA
jgi:DNA-binding MarR family transcriptional regulator